jgi:hypothetical protein
MSIENNNTAATEIVETPVVAVETVTAQATETPKAPEAKAPKIDIVTRFKAGAESVREKAQAWFNNLALKTPMEIGIACLICMVIGALTATTIHAATMDAKVTAAEKALDVAKAEAGIKPTWSQHLYGTVVQPVADGASWTYQTTKNADGKTYGVITSPFRTSPGTVEIKVSAPTVK